MKSLRRLLDYESQHDVVAAAIRPPLAGREQARLLQDQPKLIAWAELPAVARVPTIRLEERHDVTDEIVESARVVQELADRDALNDGRGLPIKVEQTLRHELENGCPVLAIFQIKFGLCFVAGGDPDVELGSFAAGFND